jgi:hypothetical protein
MANPPPMKVQAPDGSTVSFPAGTPDDQVSAFMRMHYGNSEYLQPRGLSQVGQDLDDTVRNSTFGFGDKAAALADTYLPTWASRGAGSSSDYATNLAADRAQSQVALDRTGPVPSMVATLPLGGAIAKCVGAVTGGVREIHRADQASAALIRTFKPRRWRSND